MTPGRPPPAPGTSFLAAWRQLCPVIATLLKSQPVLSLGGAQSNPIFAKRHRGWKMGNGSEAPTACTISFLSLFKLAPFYARRLLRPVNCILFIHPLPLVQALLELGCPVQTGAGWGGGS